MDEWQNFLLVHSSALNARDEKPHRLENMANCFTRQRKIPAVTLISLECYSKANGKRQTAIFLGTTDTSTPPGLRSPGCDCKLPETTGYSRFPVVTYKTLTTPGSTFSYYRAITDWATH